MFRDLPQRRPLRLRGHDYGGAGRYFVTIMTYRREDIFGEVTDGVMCLSAQGECVVEVWTGLTRHYRHVSLDSFVVMPNHVHGIVVLEFSTADGAKRTPLFEVIRGFKTYAARRVNGIRGVSGAPIWQRSYYERIIRNERDLHAVRQYIAANPARWDQDIENPHKSR